MMTAELDKVSKVKTAERVRLMNEDKLYLIWQQPLHSATPFHAPQLETIFTILWYQSILVAVVSYDCNFEINFDLSISFFPIELKTSLHVFIIIFTYYK